LRVNVDPLFSRMVLSPKLSSFLLRNPGLELRLETRDRIADLVSDGFDLAVRFGEPTPSALIARRLLDARILTVASPSYIARHGRPRHPQDLARQDLPRDAHQCILAIDASTGRPFDWEFRRGHELIPVTVNGRLTVSDMRSRVAALPKLRASAIAASTTKPPTNRPSMSSMTGPSSKVRCLAVIEEMTSER
jgi:DNA-binding transcriptional LysR family regulator